MNYDPNTADLIDNDAEDQDVTEVATGDESHVDPDPHTPAVPDGDEDQADEPEPEGSILDAQPQSEETDE